MGQLQSSNKPKRGSAAVAYADPTPEMPAAKPEVPAAKPQAQKAADPGILDLLAQEQEQDEVVANEVEVAPASNDDADYDEVSLHTSFKVSSLTLYLVFALLVRISSTTTATRTRAPEICSTRTTTITN